MACTYLSPRRYSGYSIRGRIRQREVVEAQKERPYSASHKRRWSRRQGSPGNRRLAPLVVLPVLPVLYRTVPYCTGLYRPARPHQLPAPSSRRWASHAVTISTYPVTVSPTCSLSLPTPRCHCNSAIPSASPGSLLFFPLPLSCPSLPGFSTASSFPQLSIH